MFDFYLEHAFRFVEDLVEICATPTNKLQKHERLERKKSLHIFHIILGAIFGFITLPLLYLQNPEIINEGKTAKILFIYIAIGFLLSYGVGTIILIKINTNCYVKRNLNLSMIIARTGKIHFDTIVLFYSLIISDWEMTCFSVPATVLAILDIIFNSCKVMRNIIETYDLSDKCTSILQGFFMFILGYVMYPLLFIFVIFWVVSTCNNRYDTYTPTTEDPCYASQDELDCAVPMPDDNNDDSKYKLPKFSDIFRLCTCR